MTKLTELEKQKAITCVGYIEGKFRCDRYKLEIAERLIEVNLHMHLVIK